MKEVILSNLSDHMRQEPKVLDRFLLRNTAMFTVSIIFGFLGLGGCRTPEGKDTSQSLVTLCTVTPDLIKAKTCPHYAKTEDCFLRLNGYVAPKEMLDAADLEFDKMYMRSSEESKSSQQLKIPLDPVESTAITHYTLVAGFRNMNEALRGDAAKWTIHQKYVYATASGLNKLPAYTGPVFRTERAALNLLDSMKETYQPGNLVLEEAFLSATLDAKFVYKTPLPGELYISYKIQSKSGRSIGEFSNFAEEKEILFLPGSVFRVVSATFDMLEFKNVLARGGPKTETVNHAQLELEEIEL